MTDKKSTPPELKKFRDEIDGLDDELIVLLAKRTALVEQVRALKKEKIPQIHNLRPGREALMLRRIYHKMKGGNFPPAAAVAMWRLIIAASTSVETDLRISTLAPRGDASCYWLAREYFGAFLPLVKQSSAANVLIDVLEKKVAVGVLPLPGGEGGAWWPSLLPYAARGIRIFAALPFMIPHGDTLKNTASAIALGYILPEPTGDDRSLLVLQADGKLSTHGLQSAVEKAGFSAVWAGIHDMGDTQRQHLIDIEGFVTGDNEMAQKLLSETGGAVLKLIHLGTYAVPIAANEEKKNAIATKNDHD